MDDPTREIEPIIEGARQYLSTYEAELKRQKARHFSADLASYDVSVDEFRSGEVSLVSFMVFLFGATNILSATTQPFLEGLFFESQLDFAQVAAERAEFLNALTARLGAAETNRLVEMSEAFRDSTINSSAFYGYVEKLASAHCIDLSEWPSLEDYFHYVQVGEPILADKEHYGRLSHAIDIAALHNALWEGVQKGYQERCRTRQEYHLAIEGGRAYLVRRLLDHLGGPKDPLRPEKGPDEASPGHAQGSGRGTGYAGSPGHRDSDPNRAAELNIAYQRALAQWKSLPSWKKLFAKRPERPKGI